MNKKAAKCMILICAFVLFCACSNETEEVTTTVAETTQKNTEQVVVQETTKGAEPEEQTTQHLIAIKEKPSKDIRTIYIKTDGHHIDKDHTREAVITVLDKEGGDSFESDKEYVPVQQVGTIKARGNSTSGGEKKPYTIKFSTPQDLFGMGEAKKWNLLANSFDRSLIRNKLAMELALAMGRDNTSSSCYVDVYLNDKFLGNYLLTEAVEAGTNRVDIDVENGNDIMFEKEVDRVDRDITYFISPKYGIRFGINDPKGLDKESEHYLNAMNVIEQFENNISNDNYSEAAKYADMDSFVDYYIVSELFKTVDFMYSSTKFYIKDGILYAGPLWDVDLSSGNAKTEFYRSYYQEGESYMGMWCQGMEWFGQLMGYSEFSQKVSDRYKEIQPLIENMINGKEGYSIDGILKAYKDSFARNYAPVEKGGAGWDISRADKADNISFAEEAQWKNLTEATEFLRKWLINRNKYLLEQLQ